MYAYSTGTGYVPISWGDGGVPMVCLYLVVLSNYQLLADMIGPETVDTLYLLVYPRPGDREVTFFVFESSCHLLIPV